MRHHFALNFKQFCSLRMPLGAIKSKCQHGPTNTYVLSSPIGKLEVISCPKGIHSMGQERHITDENFVPDPSITVALLSQLYQDNGYTYKPVLTLVDWLQTYFKEGSAVNSLPLPPICYAFCKKSSFNYKAWKSLSEKVKFGQTVSYAGLASLCGSPQACRAAGHAMSTNHVQIIIPCHRVIRSDGGLGMYTQGKRNRVKEWLLMHEGSWPAKK